MDIGVYYLVMGTQEWKPLMSNLPNVIIHELEISQTTKKLYAATFGRGVWVSDLLTDTTPKSADFYSMKISLYPNANNGSFTLKADYNEVETIQIIDIMGRVRHEESLQVKALKYGKKFNIIGLPSGLYFIKLTSGSLAKVIKMVVE